MATQKRLLIIVPAYNEAANIEKTVVRMLEFFRGRTEYDPSLVVADSSDRDDTRAIVDRLTTEHAGVEHHQFPDGAGKGEKIKSATIARPTYDVYAFIDADMPITEQEFLHIINGVAVQGANISIASKYVSGGSSNRPFHRVVVSRVGNWFFNLFLRLPIHDFIAGAKAWDRRVAVDIWPQVENPTYFFDVELMYLAHQSGLSIVEAPVRYVDPRIMTSTVNVPKLGFEFFKNTWKLHQRR